jgi:hypothetical protein
MKELVHIDCYDVRKMFPWKRDQGEIVVMQEA